jgi:hypothetical protein
MPIHLSILGWVTRNANFLIRQLTIPLKLSLGLLPFFLREAEVVPVLGLFGITQPARFLHRPLLQDHQVRVPPIPPLALPTVIDLQPKRVDVHVVDFLHWLGNFTLVDEGLSEPSEVTEPSRPYPRK